MCDVGGMKAVNMKRNLAATILLGLLLVLAAACPGGGGDSGEARVPTFDLAVVDPDLIEELEQEGEALVYIALQKSEIPLLEQTLDEAMTHTALVQESVLSVLQEDDFTVTHQFPATPGLGGYITMSGVEKLVGHPDVRSIVLVGGVKLN